MRRAQAAGSDRMRPGVVVALIGLLLASGIAGEASADDPPSARSLAAAFRSAAERARPGVVTVRAGGPDASAISIGAGRTPIASLTRPGGSGVVIDAGRGLVLTNDHVVEDALVSGGPPVVGLPDGRVRPVIDLRRDPRSDLALLAIDPVGLGLVALDWGDSGTLEVGDWVLAVGQPFGLDGTVAAGIVGGTGRTLALESYRDLIQTDAAINPGGSGGALVDLDGLLVGINVAVRTIGGGIEGVGFAVPSRRARRIAEDLADFGRVRRSAIGVRVGPADPELAATLDPPGAVRVEAVSPGGPAGRAGLAPGDLIVSAGGIPVSAPDRLISAVEFAAIGAPMPLRVLRGDRIESVDVVPEPQDPDAEAEALPIASAGPPIEASLVVPPANPPEPAPRPEIRLPEPPASRDPSRFPGLGLRLEQSSAELADRFGFDPGVSGVVIVGIVPGGPADLGGLAPGMVITDLLDRRIASLADFREAVATAPPDRDLILRVVNRGRAEFRILLRGDRDGGGDGP